MFVILPFFLFAHISFVSLAFPPKTCLPALKKPLRLSMAVLPDQGDAIVDLIAKAGAGGVSLSVLAQRGGELWEKIAANFGKRLSMLTPEFDPFENKYIPRSVDNTLSRVRNRADLLGNFYYLVLGPKGAGKSTLVANTFMDKMGTISVQINYDDSPGAIVNDILSKCKIDVPTDTLDMKQLHRPLLQARAVMKKPFNLIIEMNMGSADTSTLRTIKAAARSLAKYATVIIVLSDTNAAFSRKIEPREEIIWVDGMTNEEAHLLAKDIKIPLNDMELNDFFTKVGTLPLQIVRLQKDLLNGKSLKEIIDDAVRAARKSLASFAFKKILAKMKQYPEGVDAASAMEGLETDVLQGVGTDLFDGEVEDGVDLASPEEIAPKMKNILTYHFPSGEYRLTSNALRTALRTYNPIPTKK